MWNWACALHHVYLVVNPGGGFLYNSEPTLGLGRVAFMSNVCSAHLSRILRS